MSACSLCGGDPALPVFGRWEVFVPVLPLSQNRGGVNRGKERFAYASLRDVFRARAARWRTEQGIPWATSKRRLTVDRRAKGIPLDHGNLVGGCKPLLDALVLERLLEDDSPRWSETYYRQGPPAPAFLHLGGAELVQGVHLVLEVIEQPNAVADLLNPPCHVCRAPIHAVSDRIPVHSERLGTVAHALCLVAGQKKRRAACPRARGGLGR